MKRIGLLGGTFNPIHIGHLAIAQSAQECLKLDKVIFVPAYLPPHKTDRSLANAADRFRMVKLAVADNPNFAVTDFEIKKGGKSHTIDTVLYFKKIYPKAKLFFIIGGDLYAGLTNWKSIDKLIKLTQFVVVSRKTTTKSSNHLPCDFISMPHIEISSSFVRQEIAKKKSLRYLVPQKVLGYIHRHHLYQPN